MREGMLKPKKFVRKPWGGILLGIGIVMTLMLAACETPQAVKQFGSESGLFKRGGVELRSQPSGAMVYINQKQYGRTPQRVALQPGLHLVILKKRGYADSELWLDIPKGKTITETVQMEKLKK